MTRTIFTCYHPHARRVVAGDVERCLSCLAERPAPAPAQWFPVGRFLEGGQLLDDDGRVVGEWSAAAQLAAP